MKKPVISRRRVLQGAGMLAAMGVMPGFNVAFADAPVDQRFILYILRGAANGLQMIPPYGDKDYKKALGVLAQPRESPQSLDNMYGVNSPQGGLVLPREHYTKLDDFYGAHSTLVAFTEMFKQGEAAAIHAVASPYRERSHFDAQNVIETGLSKPQKVHEGWLNRVLALYGARGRDLGLAFGQAVPLVAQGENPVFCWAPSEQGLPEQGLLNSLGKIYSDDPLFKQALEGAIGVHGMLDKAEKTAVMGDEDLKKEDTIIKSPAEFASGSEMKMVPNKIAVQNAMSSIGSLLSHPKGPRIATIDQGGWDTHILEDGLFAFNSGLLDQAFTSLKAGLGEHWKKTVIMVITEFGRTVSPNGTLGTDHGTASCVLLAGGALAEAKIHGQWPGLAKDRQYKNRDLNPTTDMRAIAKSVLTGHLGFPLKDISPVFPGSDDVLPLEGLFKKT